MKRDAIVINTSRGGIINEKDLYDVMQSGHLSGAAIDVFDKEPYEGVLNKLDNVVLTAHIGASSRQSRLDMEYRATEDCIRVLKGMPPLRPAPKVL